MTFESVQRTLSVTESMVITSLDANWIDYKMQDWRDGLELVFSSKEKLDNAIKVLSKKLKDHNFGYNITEVEFFWNKNVKLVLGREIIILRLNNWFLEIVNSVKDKFFKFLQ